MLLKLILDKICALSFIFMTGNLCTLASNFMNISNVLLLMLYIATVSLSPFS